MTSVPPPPSDPAEPSPGRTGPSPHRTQQHSGTSGEQPPPSSPGPGPSLPQGAPAPGDGAAPPGPPPGTDLAADLGAALTFAGRAMLRNPAAYLVPALVYSLLVFLILVGAALAGGMLIVAQTQAPGYRGEPSGGDIALVLAVIYGLALLAVPVSLLWQSGAARSGLVVLEGGRPRIGQAMIGPWRVILTALLSGVLIVVGTLLLYIPGLIAAVLLLYAIPASVRGASPIAALTESVRLARAHLGTTIVAYLVLGVISAVAGMFLLPVVIMVPFLILFQLGMYERVSGRALTEPARA